MPNDDKQNSANVGRRENVNDMTKNLKTNLPPTLSRREKFWSCAFRIIMLVTSVFLAYVCFQILRGSSAVPDCVCWVYLALFLFLVSLMFERYIGHEIAAHNARLEDESEVRLLIQEANQIKNQPRWVGGSYSDREFESLTTQINEEIGRLGDLGPSGWVEYQTLVLERLVVGVLEDSDLISKARLSLAEVEEYAMGGTFSYDSRQFSVWDKRINSSILKIEENILRGEKEDKRPVENLRSDLRSLLDHIAAYKMNWSLGKTIINQIKICGATAVIIFVIAGLFDIYYPNVSSKADSPVLGLFSWGLLGSAGAIISVLYNLRNTDIVEVGNTQGSKELWDAVLGAVLGFVAGILVLSILAGRVILSGAAVPDVFASYEASHVYLSVTWAVVAGMGLEKVFNRVRKLTNL